MKWIPASRKPKGDCLAVAVSVDDQIWVFTAFRRGWDKWCKEFFVTHWMPLPKPPKARGK